MNLERVPVRRLGQIDLIPLPPTNGNFCRRDEAGRLIITVMNQGTLDAIASITRIEFANGERQLVATPAIPAGRSVEVLATFPRSCFNPNCTFRIAVDSTDVVSELNEGNNAAGGTCGG
jgi:subtilase family serine protease